jgi:hypothetical protein
MELSSGKERGRALLPGRRVSSSVSRCVGFVAQAFYTGLALVHQLAASMNGQAPGVLSQAIE